MEDGTLTITGDRKCEKEENGKKYPRVERAYGSFGRSFSLPDDASPAKVTADFKDGVLKVHLAKNENARPQQFEVSLSYPAPFGGAAHPPPPLPPTTHPPPSPPHTPPR